MRLEYLLALITLIIAILLAIILLSIVKDDEAQSEVQVGCIDPTEREKIRDIMLKAIDRGLEEQIIHLFETWMKDPSDQPRRAQVGSNNAVNAHIRAREAALRWDPPAC